MSLERILYLKLTNTPVFEVDQPWQEFRKGSVFEVD